MPRCAIFEDAVYRAAVRGERRPALVMTAVDRDGVLSCGCEWYFAEYGKMAWTVGVTVVDGCGSKWLDCIVKEGGTDRVLAARQKNQLSCGCLMLLGHDENNSCAYGMMKPCINHTDDIEWLSERALLMEKIVKIEYSTILL